MKTATDQSYAAAKAGSIKRISYADLERIKGQLSQSKMALTRARGALVPCP